MKKTYSQKEIAAILNVSRATIDRVIHNRGDISEVTVKRVKEFLSLVDYKPNKVGRGLSKKLNKKITFIYHVPENEFFSEIQRGIQSAANEMEDYGFTIDVKFANRNSNEQIQIIQQQIQEGADAIVLSPFEPEKFVHIIELAYQNKIPVITFNNDVPESKRMFYVGTDYYQSGRLAGELLARIVRRGTIGILIGEGNDLQVESRLKGFKEVIKHFPAIRLIEQKLNSLPNNEVSYQTALELGKLGVNAIFPLQVGLRGIVRAKQTLNAEHIDIVTFDLSSSTRTLLENGMITVAICQEPYYQGYYPMKALFDYFFDQKLPIQPIRHTKLDVIVKENLVNYTN